MKKIFYTANIRLPTEKAHGIQIMEMCEAFAAAGVQVELIVPRRRNAIHMDPFAYYHVEQTFDIRRVFSLDLVWLGRIGFLVQALSFSLALLFYARAVMKREEDAVFYSRDEMSAYFLSLLGVRVAWETHMGHDNFFIRSLIRREVPIISISQGLSDLYVSQGAHDILLSPDGVDLEQFQIRDSQEEARQKLGLPIGTPLVVYTGHLYSWKGADTLAEAARALPGVTVVLVGGTKEGVDSFRTMYGQTENLMIVGGKPHEEIPLYLRAADVVVIPNSAKEKISRLYTSPMKLFEYMASGTPIIASDLPSIREVLNEDRAVFFAPDDSESLARATRSLLSDPEKRERLSAHALSAILQYSWSRRAAGIISSIFHD